MKKYEVVAACERHGIPVEDHRRFWSIVRRGRMSQGFADRLELPEYARCFREIEIILTLRICGDVLDPDYRARLKAELAAG